MELATQERGMRHIQPPTVNKKYCYARLGHPVFKE